MFTPVFDGVRVAHIFSFLRCVCVFLLSLSCVLCAQCYQFLWIYPFFITFSVFSNVYFPLDESSVCNIIKWICWTMLSFATGLKTTTINKLLPHRSCYKLPFMFQENDIPNRRETNLRSVLSANCVFELTRTISDATAGRVLFSGKFPLDRSFQQVKYKCSYNCHYIIQWRG